jgi:hypothetical protein
MITNSFDFLLYIFFATNLFSWKICLLIFIIVAISSHIDMSIQDVKSTLNGLIPFIVLSYIIILYVSICIEMTFKGMAGVLFIFNIYYFYFLLICAIINILIGTILKIFYKIKR